MYQFKILMGMFIFMFGGAMLVATWMAPYVDGGIGETIAGADMALLFLGIASVFFGGNIMGSAMTELDIESKRRWEKAKLPEQLIFNF